MLWVQQNSWNQLALNRCGLLAFSPVCLGPSWAGTTLAADISESDARVWLHGPAIKWQKEPWIWSRKTWDLVFLLSVPAVSTSLNLGGLDLLLLK